MQRRTLLKGLFIWASMPLSLLAGRLQAATWFSQAFEAKKTSDALTALHATDAQLAADIQISAPQKAENGAVVQVEVATPAAAGEMRYIRLLADANPTPLIASFALGKPMLPKLVTRIKLAQSGDIIALVESVSGHMQQQRRPVTVLEDGCAGSEREEPFASSMKMRARILESGDESALVELKIIILHPMRTGRSKNDDGQLMPAHFMQTMQVMLNGQVVVDAQTGTAISRNPYFTFYVQGAHEGDVIAVHWQDNRGFEGHGQVTVST